MYLWSGALCSYVSALVATSYTSSITSSSKSSSIASSVYGGLDICSRWPIKPVLVEGVLVVWGTRMDRLPFPILQQVDVRVVCHAPIIGLCGRTTRNSTLTEALVFYQTLSTPKASYSGRYPSGTPQGRTRKIHIFPKDPIMRMSYNTCPFHASKFLKSILLQYQMSECGMINNGI